MGGVKLKKKVTLTIVFYLQLKKKAFLTNKLLNTDVLKHKKTSLNPSSLSPVCLFAFPAPIAPFTSPPLLPWCSRGTALVLERGHQVVCGHSLVAVVPSRSSQWPTFPSGLSLSPQPLYFSSLSASLWPRLASVASATRPAPLSEFLTLCTKLSG